jgi:hypothetical protein
MPLYGASGSPLQGRCRGFESLRAHAGQSPFSASACGGGSHTLELDQATEATEQLAPERARSYRNALTMCRVMVDEIRLPAHARPLDEPEPD